MIWVEQECSFRVIFSQAQFLEPYPLVEDSFYYFAQDYVEYHNFDIKRRTKRGGWAKPCRLPNGVKGKISVVPTITIVVRSKYFHGKLLKNGLRVRITSTPTF
jgi:hypothetical protein